MTKISEEIKAIGSHIEGLGYDIEYDNGGATIRIKRRDEKINHAWPLAIVLTTHTMEVHKWNISRVITRDMEQRIDIIHLSDPKCLDRLGEFLCEIGPRSSMERTRLS